MERKRNTSTMSRKRILLVFLNTGGGHKSTAKALREALEELSVELVDVQLADMTSECFPWPFSELGAIYEWMVQKRWPWRLTYRLTDTPRGVAMLEDSWWFLTGRSTLPFLRENPADALVCCHPLLKAPAVRALGLTGDDTSLTTLVTDLASGHAAWFYPGDRACLVATHSMRERALACGAPPDTVHVTRLPVRSCFARVAEEDRAKMRRYLGLDPDGTVVLLLSGADGMGPLASLLNSVADCHPEAQMVAVAGRNEDLRAKLASRRWPQKVHIKGFLDNIHEWMRAADLMVTKAGPSTIAEALVVGTPMVVCGAVPGQEPPNVDYVTETGAGVWAPTPDRAAQAVQELLSEERDELERMTRRAEEVGHPRAAERAARIVWDTAQLLPRP